MGEATGIAECDLRAGTPHLLLASGEAPVAYATDGAFEKRFRLTYQEEGCVATRREYMAAYNHRILDHLQATYGKTWRPSIRKDVVGLKQWKRT